MKDVATDVRYVTMNRIHTDIWITCGWVSHDARKINPLVTYSSTIPQNDDACCDKPVSDSK
jgi:hypothetical protein